MSDRYFIVTAVIPVMVDGDREAAMSQVAERLKGHVPLRSIDAREVSAMELAHASA